MYNDITAQIYVLGTREAYFAPVLHTEAPNSLEHLNVLAEHSVEKSGDPIHSPPASVIKSLCRLMAVFRRLSSSDMPSGPL